MFHTDLPAEIPELLAEIIQLCNEVNLSDILDITVIKQAPCGHQLTLSVSDSSLILHGNRHFKTLEKETLRFSKCVCLYYIYKAFLTNLHVHQRLPSPTSRKVLKW